MVYSGQDKAIGLAQQTAFGTAAADASAFAQLVMEPATIEHDVEHYENRQANRARHGLATDVDNDASLAMPGLALVGDAKLIEVPDFLYGFFQKVSEEGTTPFRKTFDLPVADPHQPDFESDAGYFATLIERRPLTGDSHKILDAICKSLSFSIEPRGRLKLSSEWIARGLPSTSTPSGTWTISANSFFKFTKISTCTMDWGSGATTLRLKSMNLNFAQDVERVGYDPTTDKFETFYIGNRVLDWTAVFQRDSNAAALKTARDSGTLVTSAFGFGNAGTPGSVAGDFHFSWTGKLNKVDDDNEGYLGVEIGGTMLAADNTASPITVICSDAVQRSW